MDPTWKRVRTELSDPSWICSKDGHLLETERLTLRPMQASDEADLLRALDDNIMDIHGWTNRQEVWDQHYSEGGTPSKPYSESWAIVLKKTNTVIGTRSVYTWATRNAVGVTGSWIGNEWQRKGLGTEELDAVLRLSHQHLGIRDMLAATEESNRAAIGLYTKCGFFEVARGPYELNPTKTVDAVWLQHSANTQESCQLRPSGVPLPARFQQFALNARWYLALVLAIFAFGIYTRSQLLELIFPGLMLVGLALQLFVLRIRQWWRLRPN